MPGNPEFGKLIRQLREEKKKEDPTFSLRGFAEKVELSPTFLSKVEKGEFAPPKAENIIKMANLLGYDADKLLALAGKVDPSLSDIIRDKPRALADFLRVASGRSEEEIRRLTEQMLKNDEVKEE
ncbi:MAG TPA: helix-turn-helix transcriptional regulator [Candidatus Hydrogenedentes bacterium]|nr:helix-turn-helix transcriptional regulator [Candidatus Hydrogenedentota bacterium]